MNEADPLICYCLNKISEWFYNAIFEKKKVGKISQDFISFIS